MIHASAPGSVLDYEDKAIPSKGFAHGAYILILQSVDKKENNARCGNREKIEHSGEASRRGGNI